MEWLKKNSIVAKHLLAAFICLSLILFGVFHLAYNVIPAKIQSDALRTCKNLTEDRSYHLKQFILENINNAKIWVDNRKSSFFDTRWFAISFYEHDGREWILKDFKLNSFALDIYKITPSEYIKMEQTLIAPHARSEQIHVQSSKIQDFPIFVIDASNNIPELPKNHMIRISLLTDLITAQLNINDDCSFSLFDTRGNFLFSGNTRFQDEILNYFQKNTPSTESLTNTSVIRTEGSLAISKKLLKNLNIVTEIKSNKKIFSSAFAQFLIINGILSIALLLLFTKVIRAAFKDRLVYIKTNIKNISENKNISFDMYQNDELNILDEEIAKIKDQKTKKTIL